MSKNVLLIGLRSDVVDFSKWPELTREKLEASFEKTIAELTKDGYNAQWCLTDLGKTAVEVISAKLRERKNNVVVIGAGVRKDPDLLLLFERIINTIVEVSPNSKIAFNTLPFDTVEAVKRWS